MSKRLKRARNDRSLVNALFIGMVISGGLFLYFLGQDSINNKPTTPPDISAYYCDPASAYKREALIIACLNNKTISPIECEEIGRKVYGAAGFKRGGKIFPCFKAISPNEKLACGEL